MRVVKMVDVMVVMSVVMSVVLMVCTKAVDLVV